MNSSMCIYMLWCWVNVSFLIKFRIPNTTCIIWGDFPSTYSNYFLNISFNLILDLHQSYFINKTSKLTFQIKGIIIYCFFWQITLLLSSCFQLTTKFHHLLSCPLMVWMFVLQICLSTRLSANGGWAMLWFLSMCLKFCTTQGFGVYVQSVVRMWDSKVPTFSVVLPI